MVAVMNSWIVTMYPFSPSELICSACHNFLSSFVFPGLDLTLYEHFGGCYQIGRGRLHYRCTLLGFPVLVRVAQLLLLLVCFILVDLYSFWECLFSMFVVSPGLHSFDIPSFLFRCQIFLKIIVFFSLLIKGFILILYLIFRVKVFQY